MSRRSARNGLATALLALAVSVSGCAASSRAARRPRWPESVSSTVSAVSTSPRPERKETVIWAHGGWCWFGDPRAVYVARRHETFVGWIGWKGQITVGAYDPRSGFRASHAIGSVAPDDHGAPALLLEPDGRLTVFWSAHSGPRMNYRTSKRPYDLGAWGPTRQVHAQLSGSKGFTYPNPVMLSAEHDRLYLFWRGANWSADFATRSITGRWSPARQMITVPHQRPYVKVATNGTDTIALAFTNGHPRGVMTSVYYAAYRDGALWTAARRRIATVADGPIAPDQADLVYDARKTGVRAWVWDVALDRQGRPVIVYATFPSPARHIYWYATWNGQRWISHRMAVGGPTISPHTIESDYSGGLALDHADPSIVYLSRKVRGWFEIERWSTSDGGYSWRYSAVARTPGANNVRPVVPRGSGDGPIQVLWLHGHYGSYQHYRTSIAFLK